MRTSGASMRPLPAGGYLIKPDEALQAYPKVLTDRLMHWAQVSPNKVCIAKRGADDQWRTLTYAQVWDSVRSIGQALLDRGLSVERPVAILSENDLEHFLLTLAGQHVGIPTAPISPPYSLVSKDFGKLRHTLKIVTPGLVFVADGTRYAPAIETVVEEHIEVAATTAPPDRR
ncbi:MAG TPA: AMP-binding protein, partial [Candidatus Acidoferrales bacterium]|nr:AMP-binding protein [Candidatus Acidoferrales bacterium]